MSEKPPPDFAMLRAVELLAKMHEAGRNRVNTPPPALDRAVILRSERIAFELGITQRAGVERQLGVAFSYPVRGWHTYATKEAGRACLLSLFYKDGRLLAAELYVPRTDRAPSLAPRDFGGFVLTPGGIAIGSNADAAGGVFTPAAGGPAALVYDRALEARFPGGVAYAMANKGVVERLALYADSRA